MSIHKRSHLSKVAINNRSLWKNYGSQVAVISSVVTLLSFCISLPENPAWKLIAPLFFVILLASLFLFDWWKANHTKSVHLTINKTNVNIEIGNLFSKEGLKIIGVNNHIDLIADDKIISKATLHGRFILQHQAEISEIKKAIEDSETLIPQKEQEKSYEYGSCVLYKDYILTVLTKFDGQNRAYTSIQEYIKFWMTFWSQIDMLYNSRTINIPLMGAGQTRFRGIIPKKQELLEIALWTLKESGFSNRYSDKAINFIIHENDAPEIDFYRIQQLFWCET